MNINNLTLRLESIERKLDALSTQSDEILSFDEFCHLAKIPLSTGYRSVKFVPHFKRGKRNYFFRSAVIAWLTANPQLSVEEMKALAADKITSGKP